MQFFDKTIIAAIFDMDGTMFDTERLRMEMLRQASRELAGESIADELLIDCLGVSAVTAERMAKERYGADYPYREIRARADEKEREHIRTQGVPVKTGLYNLLERLKKSDVFIALATSSRREIAEEYLIQAKVYRYFNILVCGDEVEHGKPHPEIFEKAAAELMCVPSECLIFEDSENGLKAAWSAGGLPIYIRDIKEPAPDVRSLAFRSYNAMTEFVDDLTAFTPKPPMPLMNEPFPQSEENIVAGIHGFGAIGGGYFAPIFMHWDGYTRPGRIIGATRDPVAIHLVNALGKYRIRYESQAYFQTISSVELIAMDDAEAMRALYVQSDILGLALPEGAIRTQAKTIADGLLARCEAGKSPLPILIAMNKTGAARFVRTHVAAALRARVSPEEAERVLARVTWVETVVNRMVTPVSEQFLLSKFRQDLNLLDHSMREIFEHSDDISRFFEQFAPAPGRRRPSGTASAPKSNPASVSGGLSVLRQLSGAVEEVTNTLFIAEPDMPLYAAGGCPVVDRLRQVIPVKDIRSLQEIKNKLSNGPHAVIAWYSLLLGYRSIGQGMGDPRVEALARRIMQREIAPALLAESPEFRRYIQDFTGPFIKRCRNSFKDRCTRVGRDTLRKLQRDERIVGAIRMAQAHGLPTDGLEFGAACAILCCASPDNLLTDAEALRTRALFAARGSAADVLAYDGEYHKGTYKGLDREKDSALIARIQGHIDRLRASICAAT